VRVELLGAREDPARRQVPGDGRTRASEKSMIEGAAPVSPTMMLR
jgi:hypothetical protein